MVTAEFQAVVLAAGTGSRLPELAREYPKCLLPIGPHPLLWYPLHMLQEHGFQDAIVIVLESQKSEIQQAMENVPIKMKLDYVTIPSDSDFGTADSLRYIYDKIKTDIIVVSCDIITNCSLYPLINKFRQHSASLVVYLFKSGFERGVVVPGPKTKYRPERDLIGIQSNTDRLVLLASTSDFEDDFILTGHLIRKYGRIDIYSRLVDSHIYIMRKWVLDFLKKKEHFSTLKGEFLPYIIKKQMCKIMQPSMDGQSEFGLNIKEENDILNYVPQNNLCQQIINSSLFNDSRNREPYSGDIIRCYAVVGSPENVAIRVNTTLLYFAVNQKITSIWSGLIGDKNISLISSSAVVNSTQTKDISVAENAKISEKTSLSRSAFGPYCNIHPKVIIVNSVIMSNATVEEGCTIENSIICNKAVIKKGAVLKNCLIGSNYIVEEGFQKDTAHLTNADGFMEID